MGNKNTHDTKHNKEVHPEHHDKDHNPPPEEEMPAALPKMEGQTELLKDDDIRLLCKNLRPDCTKKWKLLFNTTKHGLSFNRFMAHCCDHGPTIVLLRDKSGYVFGGFAAVEWKKSGKFFGSPDCFLFRLLPEPGVWRSCGDNENYMWLNHGTETLYNGVGMGGQMDFFAWCLDDFFETGHCRGNPSSTFRNPQLSEKTEFQLDFAEVWEVKEKVKLDEFGKPVSVLNDEDNPDKKILEMQGHEFSVLNLGPNIHDLESDSLSS